MPASLFGRDKMTNPAMDIPLRKAHGFEHVRISPEIAAHWLTFNIANRDEFPKKQEAYKNDMLAGKWNDDGSTICFAYGKLIDGQNRLKALIAAGVTIRMLVVYGLDSEVQVTKDTGRGRSSRDILSMEGLDSWCSRTMGTAIHLLISYDMGKSLYNVVKYTNREVRDFYLERQASLDATARFCRALPRKNPLLPHYQVMALHHIFSRKDSTAATAFFDGLMVGADLSKSSPVFVLRKLLDADMKDGKRRSVFEQLCFTIKAWNTFKAGGSVRTGTYLYPRDGDPFPEIK